jgi:hypothetical protein
MSINDWILLGFAVIGWVLAIGRWTHKVESPVTLAMLARDLEHLGGDMRKDIAGLRSVFETGYTDLTGRYSSDHLYIRELLDWKAGWLAEAVKHFHTIPMIDRMRVESERDRLLIREDLNTLKARVDRVITEGS